MGVELMLERGQR